MRTKHAVAVLRVDWIYLVAHPRIAAAVLLDAPLDTPVEHVIILIPFTDKEIPEELPQVGVVGLVVEPQGSSVVQEDGKFVRETTTEKVGRCSHLLLHDPIVLLLLCSGLEALPGEGTTEEVHEDVREGFEIITASLFNSKVSVNGGVTGSAGKILVLPVGNVEVSLRVSILLGKTEIDHVDLVATFSDPHQEVVWLDVAVNEVARVYVLDARYQLISK